jgi:hypothetical protein
MSEEAYIEGWRENDPLADIRRFRTEIALATEFGTSSYHPLARVCWLTC